MLAQQSERKEMFKNDNRRNEQDADARSTCEDNRGTSNDMGRSPESLPAYRVSGYSLSVPRQLTKLTGPAVSGFFFRKLQKKPDTAGQERSNEVAKQTHRQKIDKESVREEDFSHSYL